MTALLPASALTLDEPGQAPGFIRAPRGIVFQSIAEAAPHGSDPRKPAVFIATTAADTRQFVDWLRDDDRKAALRNDWSARVVVAVFNGAVGSSGFSIRVSEIRREHDKLYVRAVLKRPPPEAMALPAFTSPYHIVAVPRAAFGASVRIPWILEDSTDQVIAQGP